MSNCPNCKKPTTVIKTVLRQNKVTTGCERCLDSRMQGNAAKYERKWQQGQYRKDTLQPNQTRDFVRAYGEKAREYGYDDDMLRKYS